MSVSCAPVSAQLRWRCRRGTRELDTLLDNFLADEYHRVPESERGLFASLLEFGDDELMSFFFGSRTPADTGLASLVDQIRRTAPR